VVDLDLLPGEAVVDIFKGDECSEEVASRMLESRSFNRGRRRAGQVEVFSQMQKLKAI